MVRRESLLVVVLLAWFALAQVAQAAAPVLVYHGDAEPVRVTPDEVALAQRVAAALTRPGGSPPLLDRALVGAARNLTRGTSPRSGLSASGVSDAFALPVSYTAVDGMEPMAPVRELLETDVRRAEPTHFGVGIVGSGATTRVGMVFVRRGARLGRFPRYVEIGDKFLLNGQLEQGYTEPLLLLATPDGRVQEHKPRFEHGVFWARIPFLGGAGRYHIELQARDRFGVQVLNLMEVHAFHPGEPREAAVVRLRPAAVPVADAAQAEERAVRLINRARKMARLAPVTLSATLRDQARRHSNDMVRDRWFGHDSPTRGGLGKRMERAGLADVLAVENVAVAPSPELAHSELVRSPSHLRNILDPDVTHVGVGARQRRGGAQPVFTFTQIFARLP
ncbi:MAG: hypothetical protein ACI9WU_000544 [Myxococcota bacterium]|jgi:uncharacterized protein YkwD